MMDTPILDFVRRYDQSHAMRLHMPGHKGKALLGMEPMDITEIDGADSLYEATGIIRQSEANASTLFGSDTIYSTEGCSQCIRAMLYLVTLYAKENGKKPLIAAARNAHKTFLSAVALLDLDVLWLYPEKGGSYLSCSLNLQKLEEVLSREAPAAVYLTSPDYLGNMADIATVSALCRQYGTLLLVDNAHGAYLRFLTPSAHPIDLGADLCCDSAHKTLPVLTGGAYLHISRSAPAMFREQVKNGMMLFGSTSPSYLILQSLDGANAYMADNYSQRLTSFVTQLQGLKNRLRGYCLCGNEPLKITIQTKPYGYTGKEFAEILQQKGIFCEFSDPDYVVLMLTPENTPEDLNRLEQVLNGIPRRVAIAQNPPRIPECRRVMSVRQAVLSPNETVPVEEAVGRVLAAASVSCPPAVPIAVCGEKLYEDAVKCFAYYGIKSCIVVKRNF